MKLPPEPDDPVGPAVMDQVSAITHSYSVSVLTQAVERDVCLIARHPSLTAARAFCSF